jgi:hypothetical protein
VVKPVCAAKKTVKKKSKESMSTAGAIKKGGKTTKQNAKFMDQKVGVMNPYVLARLLSPPNSISMLNEIDLNDPLILRQMNAHFKKNKQVKKTWTYKTLRNNLFNPQVSPLYKPLKGISGSYLVRDGKGIKGVPAGARHLVDTKDYVIGVDDLVREGATNPQYTNPPKTYGAAPGGPVYIDKTNTNRVAILGDVIQGAAPDCYFHAALWSTVWVYYSSFPWAVDKIKFFKNGAWSPYIPVTATFPLDLGGNLVFAQKSETHVPNITSNEYWAMAWEKAYAQSIPLIKSTLSGARNINAQQYKDYDPEIGTFGSGSTLTTLKEITSKSWTAGVTAFNFTDYPDVNCYDTLFTKNSTYKNTVGTVISTMTTKPTVAWTKATPFDPNIKNALVASHGYSVLGTFTPDNGATQFIILRNPWGNDFNTNILADLAQGGSYQHTNMTSAQPLGPSSTMGIFAINNNAFKTYFAGFGWVV